MTTTLGYAPSPVDTADEITGVMNALAVVTRERRLETRAMEKTLNVSLAQLTVLRLLMEREDQTITDLAQATATHQSSTSVVVRRLVEAGLATSALDPKDKRIVRVNITERGDALVRQAPLTVTDRIERALSRMSPTHRRQLRSLLQGLVVDAGYTLL